MQPWEKAEIGDVLESDYLPATNTNVLRMPVYRDNTRALSADEIKGLEPEEITQRIEAMSGYEVREFLRVENGWQRIK